MTSRRLCHGSAPQKPGSHLERWSSLGPCPPPSLSPSVPRSLSPATPTVLITGRPTDLGQRQVELAELSPWAGLPDPRTDAEKAWLTEPPRYPPPKHPRLLRKLGSPFSILRGGTPSPLGLLGGPERGSEQGCTVCSQGHCPVAPEMIPCPRKDPLLGPCPCASLTGAPSTPPQVLAEEHGRESVSFLGTKAPWPGSWLPQAPVQSPYGNPSGWDRCPTARPGGRADISG